ncbi:MAG: hypothetical protein K2X35_01020 [Bryobacteraceae bacterium]|nr:hypothetical protein [Bryobacteraceae bacterium]
MDPENPVVRLCAEGIRAEQEGRPGDAACLYQQAWKESRDDWERCIAAHYLARHQPDPAQTLFWNQESLRLADSAGGDRVRDFYPSLYLNLGHSLEVLGRAAEACRYYRMAASRMDALPPGRYSDVVRHGVAEAQRRTC